MCGGSISSSRRRSWWNGLRPSARGWTPLAVPAPMMTSVPSRSAVPSRYPARLARGDRGGVRARTPRAATRTCRRATARCRAAAGTGATRGAARTRPATRWLTQTSSEGIDAVQPAARSRPRCWRASPARGGWIATPSIPSPVARAFSTRPMAPPNRRIDEASLTTTRPGQRAERGDVLERSDGQDRPVVLRCVERGREHDRCRTVGQAVELVHRADGDRVGELGRDRRERVPPEPVPVALDDRDQPGRGIDDRPDVPAPLGAVDRQSHRHDARRYRLGHSPPPRARIRTERRARRQVSPRPDRTPERAPAGRRRVPESVQNVERADSVPIRTERPRSPSIAGRVPESVQNAGRASNVNCSTSVDDRLRAGANCSSCGRRWPCPDVRANVNCSTCGRHRLRAWCELFELGRRGGSRRVGPLTAGVGAGAAGPGGEAGDQRGDGAFPPHALPHSDAVRHVVGEVDGMAQRGSATPERSAGPVATGSRRPARSATTPAARRRRAAVRRGGCPARRCAARPAVARRRAWGPGRPRFRRRR